MPIKFTLNETIKNAGITKKQLADMSGVRPNTITEICAGKSGRLSVQTMNAILDALNCVDSATYGLDAILEYVEPTGVDAE